MLCKFLFPGYYFIHIEGESCTKLLAMCAYHGMNLSHASLLSSSESNKLQRMELKLPVKYKDLFLRLCDKTNTVYSIQSAHGCIHLYQMMKKHSGLVIGAILAVLFLTVLQSRIWDIRIEGNLYYDSACIQSYLKEEQIIPGIRKHNVSCIALADSIREAFDQITWTSVELDGCNLIVHVKENMHRTEEINEKQQDTDDIFESFKMDNQGNIICTRDVTIKSIYVRRGIPMAEAGDICKAGDILVSGRVPIYNDAQEIVRYKEVTADADLTVQYSYSYFDEINREVTTREFFDTKKSSFIQIFHYLASPILPDKGKKEEAADILTTVHQLSVTPSLLLPCYYGSKTAFQYKKIQKQLTENETKSILNQNFLSFSNDLEKKGVQIYKKNVKMYISDAHGRACGTVSIYENYPFTS